MNLRRPNWRVYYEAMPSFMKKWADLIMFRQSIPDALNRYLTDEERSDGNLVARIKKDMSECRIKFNSDADEYFIFGFRYLDDAERSKFLTRAEKNVILDRVTGMDLENKELRNKYNFYKLMQRFFGRDAMLIPKGGGNSCDFFQFVRKHPDVFIKSNYLSKGRGAGLYHIENDEEAKKVYAKFQESGNDWIVEEKVNQSKEMAQWNESSVNTVRVPSFLKDGVWTCIGTAMRMGHKGAVVDNASAGGLVACIDPKTGVFYTDGFDAKHGKYYKQHPDSGITFKGWQVPRWNELLALAEQMHRTMAQHKYIGWDFALTDNGWILIEGNWGNFMSQYTDKIGLKKRVLDLLGVNE